MNNRAFTISFVIAIMAVLMVKSYVDSTEEQYKQKYGQEITVVKAKTDIKELDMLSDENLVAETVPKDFAEPGTQSDIKYFIGALAIAPISKGEQITRSKVTQLGVRTGLARKVAAGNRAITIPVSDITGIGKLVKPGDRVDILALIDLFAGNKSKMEVKTVLQAVPVLAVGKNIANTTPGIMEVDPLNPGKPVAKAKVKLSEYSTFADVTLEVTPDQAQMIVLMRHISNEFYLTLRNTDDDKPTDLNTAMWVDLFGPRGSRNPELRPK